ncbi:MAG: guanylate kinase [Eggerthellaceae bacterium]|jgi:guanylate kinase
MRKGNLFVLSGPSGTGKGTLVKRVEKRIPDVWVSISATTRAPRKGERDGVHYFFVDDETFDKMVEGDDLLEWAQVHDHRYGTPKSKILEHMAAGDQVILEIDVQGAFQVRNKIPEAILVFIEPPSMAELRCRLEGRGTESPQAIEKRMKTAEVELSRKMEYDYQLVNDNLDVATDKLVSFINGKAEN